MPLPDYLVPLDEETVRDRMLARIADTIDKSEGSFIYDALAPVAIELVIADDRLRQVMEYVFADTTFGEFLDRRVAEWRILRKPAGLATGTQRFNGTNGTLIPAGTQVSTESTPETPAVTFTTTADGTIVGGFVEVPITADLAGASGNVGADTIVFLDPITNVTSTTNPDVTAGGSDEETDEALIARYIQRVQNPSSSGNRSDYERWALEVPGVGGAAVIPLELGPGTVTVAIIDEDGNPAGAPLVATVKAYIDPTAGTGDGVAPIGPNVTVEAATIVPVDLDANLSVANGYNVAAVKLAAEANVALYLKSLIFKDDNDVRTARVVNAILDTDGVADVQNVLLNGTVNNVVLSPKQIAELDVVTWT